MELEAKRPPHTGDLPSRQWGQEQVEKALWEVAACGGNVQRAVKQLNEDLQGPDGDQGLGDGCRPYPYKTVLRWVKSTYRNRYHEIRSTSGRKLEEERAKGAMDLAARIEEAEINAVRQTLAGLADANGVEASTILRNLSQSKATQIDKATAIRGRPTGGDGSGRNLEEILRGLAASGAVQLIDETVVDAEVVEAPAILSTATTEDDVPDVIW